MGSCSPGHRAIRVIAWGQCWISNSAGDTPPAGEPGCECFWEKGEPGQVWRQWGPWLGLVHIPSQCPLPLPPRPSPHITPTGWHAHAQGPSTHSCTGRIRDTPCPRPSRGPHVACVSGLERRPGRHGCRRSVCWVCQGTGRHRAALTEVPTSPTNLLLRVEHFQVR